MTKARDLADLIATGNPLADGAISVAEISDLTASAADLNNVAGINSSVQTQLNAKAPLASPTLTGTVTMGGTTYPTSDGTEGQVLTTNGSGAVSFSDPAGGGSADFVASGAIANGDVVALNADGTVSIIGFADPSVGSPTTFTNGNPPDKDVVFDSSNNKVVVVYRDMGNSSSATAIVGTVSGSSISFGTPVVFKTGLTESISATFDTNNNKVVVVYQDNTNNSYGTAIVGTVNGTSISFGSPTIFNSIGTSDTSCTFDTNNNKVVVAYRSYQTYPWYGTAIVGTVSGTSISFGTSTVYESAQSSYNSAVFDSSNNKIVIAYEISSTTGRAVVGTVSGTSISFGTPVTFDSAGAAYVSAAFDSINNKIVIAYYGSSGSGKSLVGTVSGNSISFGTTVTFSVRAAYIATTFDVSTGKVVVAYRDWSGGMPFVIVGTVSGTSITFGTALQYSTNTTSWISSAYDSNSNKVIIADQNNNGSSLDGKAVVFDSGSTNAPSYIGVADGTTSDTATGKVTINGGVGNIPAFDVSGATYDNVSFSVASQATEPFGIFFKPDGTKFYITDNTDDGVDEYDMSTAWDISTASHVQFFSTSSSETFPSGISFKSDGTKMFITGYGSDSVLEYSLSTAWDISSATYSQTSSNFGGQIQDVFFKPDGTSFYLADAVSDDVKQYNLTTAWDVSTASYAFKNVSVSSQDVNPMGLYFKPDGTALFIVGRGTNTAYEYSLTTAWDVSTASYSGNSFSVSSQDDLPSGIFFKSDGSKMYVSGYRNNNVYQYTTGLTTNQSYFVADDGTLTTTNNGRKIGKAISATKLLVNSNMSGDEMNAYLGGLV